MKYIPFLLCWGLLLLGSCQSKEPAVPNILLIMVDDLGAADLDCYGGQDQTYPGINQLVDGGVLFTQAYLGPLEDQLGVLLQSAGYNVGEFEGEDLEQFFRQNSTQPFFATVSWSLEGTKEFSGFEQFVSDYEGTAQRKTYLASLHWLDLTLGNLLKTEGLLKNTLILFTSNGGRTKEFEKYYSSAKEKGFTGDLYEGGIRVPLIAYWPGSIPAGQQLDLPVYFPDLLPTLCEVASLPKATYKNTAGQSFLKWMKNPSLEKPDRFLYWQDATGEKQALRYRNWKMLRNSRDQDWEFYDLRTDPGETDNISAYHPGKMEKFREVILRFER